MINYMSFEGVSSECRACAGISTMVRPDIEWERTKLGLGIFPWETSARQELKYMEIYIPAICMLEMELFFGTSFRNFNITIVSAPEIELTQFHTKCKEVEGCRLIHDNMFRISIAK